MGKVTKFTGSKLLGAELRRLRGGRSLKQIADLSKTPPLSERVAPVAAPTLSQIENGISFPSLETLHSLAHIYQTSAQQLLDLVVQERLAGCHDKPASLGDAAASFAPAFATGRWHQALNIASWAEAECTGARSLLWRANRANVLVRLGLKQDGVALLQDCLNSPELPPERAYQIHQALADAFAGLGQLASAELHARAAAEVAPADLDDSARRRIWVGRAYLTLQNNLTRETPDERAAREAARLLERAISSTEPDDVPGVMVLEAYLAGCRLLTGNVALAIRDLERLSSDAAAAEDTISTVLAGLLLGHAALRLRQGGKARKHFEAAASVAMESGDHATAFEATLEALSSLGETNSDLAAIYLRRCERLAPFVGARTPSVRRYEVLTRGRA